MATICCSRKPDWARRGAARDIVAAHRAGLSSPEIQEALGHDHDQRFADSIKAQGNTFLGYAFESHEIGRAATGAEAGYLRNMLVPPPLAYTLIHRAAEGALPPALRAYAYLPPTPILNSAARGIGFYDIDADADGEIRNELTVIDFHDRMCVPFFLAVAQAYYDGAPLKLDLEADRITSVAVGHIVDTGR